MVIPPDFSPDRWVNVMDILAGRYAVAEFAGSAHGIGDAKPGTFRCELCLPVRPL